MNAAHFTYPEFSVHQTATTAHKVPPDLLVIFVPVANRHRTFCTLSGNSAPLSAGEGGMPYAGVHCDSSNTFTQSATNLSIQLESKQNRALDTLLHERLHTIQRLPHCRQLFHQFYINTLGCTHQSSRVLKIEPFWKNRVMSNPDGMDLYWTYEYAGKRYIPLLLFPSHTDEVQARSGSVEEVVVELTPARTRQHSPMWTTTRQVWPIRTSPIRLFREFPSTISCYHPNEIAAYSLSKIILGTYSSAFLYSEFATLLTTICHRLQLVSNGEKKTHYPTRVLKKKNHIK